jgi:hypothetical protein
VLINGSQFRASDGSIRPITKISRTTIKLDRQPVGHCRACGLSAKLSQEASADAGGLSRAPQLVSTMVIPFSKDSASLLGQIENRSTSPSGVSARENFRGFGG